MFRFIYYIYILIKMKQFAVLGQVFTLTALCRLQLLLPKLTCSTQPIESMYHVIFYTDSTFIIAQLTSQYPFAKCDSFLTLWVGQVFTLTALCRPQFSLSKFTSSTQSIYVPQSFTLMTDMTGYSVLAIIHTCSDHHCFSLSDRRRNPTLPNAACRHAIRVIVKQRLVKWEFYS